MVICKTAFLKTAFYPSWSASSDNDNIRRNTPQDRPHPLKNFLFFLLFLFLFTSDNKRIVEHFNRDIFLIHSGNFKSDTVVSIRYSDIEGGLAALSAQLVRIPLPLF